MVKCTQANFKEAIKLNGLKKKRFSGLKEANKEIEDLKSQVVDQKLSWNGVLKLRVMTHEKLAQRFNAVAICNLLHVSVPA